MGTLPFSDLKRKLNNLTPQEKQDILNFIGEAIGGTAGSIIGAGAGAGVASVPMAAVGAGAGATTGKGIAMGIGQMLGLGDRKLSQLITEQEPAKYPSSLGEAATDAANTFGWNATFEGLGRTVPMVARGAASKVFTQNAEGKILSDLADKYGVPLNLGQRTGSKFWQSLDQVFDRIPFTTDKTRTFRRQQYDAWKGEIDKIRQQFSANEISQEEFSRRLTDAFSKQREVFNTSVDKSIETVGKKMSPTKQTAGSAVEGLKAGRAENLAAKDAWADKEYEAVLRPIRDMSIDISSLSSDLPGLSENATKFFSGKSKALIGQADSAAAPVESALLDAQGNPIMRPSTISLGDYKQIRSELLSLKSGLQKQGSPNDASIVQRVIDNLEIAAEDAAEKSGNIDAFQKLKDLNSAYRDYTRKLMPQRAKASALNPDPENPGAKLLEGADVPEDSAKRIVQSPTLLRSVEQNASPQTVAAISDISGRVNPMGGVQRYALDETAKGAQVPFGLGSRTSPSRFGEALPDTATDLFQRNAPEVADIANPIARAREEQLYSTGIAKAVDSPRSSGDSIMDAAFPDKAPERVDEAMSVLSPAGEGDTARRAYLDDLVDRSQRLDPSLRGDQRVLSPLNLATNIEKAGETVPSVIGSRPAAQLDEVSELGNRMLAPERELGNPSGTARGNALFNLGQTAKNILDKAVTRPVEALTDITTFTGLPMMASKRYYDPKWVAEKVASAGVPPQSGPIRGAIHGALARAASSMHPSQQQQQDFSPEALGLTPVDENDEFSPERLGLTPIN